MDWVEVDWSTLQNFDEGDESGSEGQGGCEHLTTDVCSGGIVCLDCGLVINKLDYSFDKTDGNSRCQHRSAQTRGIDDVFLRSGLEIDCKTKDQVDKLYRAVVRREKVRSASRDALVAICYRFHLFKNGDCRPLSDMGKIFGVRRKYLSASLTKYYKVFPQDRVLYARPSDLVKRTLDLQGMDHIHLEPIQRMCHLVQNKSKKLNRSTPQSIASAMVFIYMKRHAPQYVTNRKEFARAVFLSEITIDKIVKEIEGLFSRPTHALRVPVT